MYENRRSPLLARGLYLRRVAMHFALAFALLLVSLGIGMLGYSHFEGLEWRDAFMNAAMLLGGMGPVHDPETPGGKLFAGCYALYCGLVFIVTVGILLVPVVHRLMHRFHLQEDEKR